MKNAVLVTERIFRFSEILASHTNPNNSFLLLLSSKAFDTSNKYS